MELVTDALGKHSLPPILCSVRDFLTQSENSLGLHRAAYGAEESSEDVPGGAAGGDQNRVADGRAGGTASARRGGERT